MRDEAEAVYPSSSLIPSPSSLIPSGRPPMTQPDEPRSRFSEEELTALRPLRPQFPTLDSALAELARLAAEATLPMGTVHVISDIHGENVKLRHIINNASGMLRPFIEGTFGCRLTPAQLQQFLALL